MWDSILQACADLLGLLAGLVGDWGLAIIIVTLVIRLLLFPLQRKQLKSSWKMQEMQPKQKRIQELYADDQQKQQEEMMKLYKEANFNPLAGCLPMLIQMPIFIILFQTLRWHLPETGVSFYSILPNLSWTVQQSGFNVVYIIFALFFILFSVAPMAYQLLKNNNPDQKSQSMIMMVMMGIMFIWMAWISPAGVVLYWALSSAFGFVQQLITNRLMDKEKQEHEEVIHRKQVEVHVERKEKKKRQHKSR